MQTLPPDLSSASRNTRTERERSRRRVEYLKTAVIGLALAGAMLLSTSPSWALQPTSFSAKVISVADGDTLTVLGAQHEQIRVRLANIDAPETGGGRCRPTQPWATQSKNFLTHMVKGKSVGLACMETDRYGRLICDVIVGDTTANRALVKAGLAWANRARPEYLRDASVATAEVHAQRAGLGLWSHAGPIEPWVWRKTMWNQDQCAPQ